MLLEPLLPVSTADPELVASEFTAALAGEVDAVSVAVASVMILVWVGDRCVQCLTKHTSWQRVHQAASDSERRGRGNSRWLETASPNLLNQI